MVQVDVLGELVVVCLAAVHFIYLGVWGNLWSLEISFRLGA